MSLQFELILPCYNESKSLEKILERTIKSAELAGFTPETFRLVLVENGSKDNSRVLMQEYKSSSPWAPWFSIVPIDVNQGYGYGIWTGLLSTTAPVIGWSHADQQCDPQDAFKALGILKSQSNAKVLVKGIRHGRSFKEIFVSRVFEFLAWIFLGFRFYEINAQPKVFPRQLLGMCQNPPKDFSLDLYVLYSALKNGYGLKTLTVEFPPRVHGFSNWAHGLKSRSRHIKNMIRYMFWLGRSQGRIGSTTDKTTASTVR